MRFVIIQDKKNPDRHPSKKEGSRVKEFAFRRLFTSYDRDGYGIFRSSYGRPTIVSRTKFFIPAIFVSISHTKGVGLAARSSVPIGADVEYIRFYDKEWGESFLTPIEQREMRSVFGRERDIRITAYWCAKEAFLKMIGVGLRIHPKKVHCAIDWKRRSVRVYGLLGISGKGRIILAEKKGYVAVILTIE